MAVQPFKYIIQPVALELHDDTGRVIRELPAEPHTAYNLEQVIEVVKTFEEHIAKLQEEGGMGASNGEVSSVDRLRQPDLPR